MTLVDVVALVTFVTLVCCDLSGLSLQKHIHYACILDIHVEACSYQKPVTAILRGGQSSKETYRSTLHTNKTLATDSAAGNVSEFGDAGLRAYAGLRGFTRVYGETLRMLSVLLAAVLWGLASLLARAYRKKMVSDYMKEGPGRADGATSTNPVKTSFAPLLAQTT